MKFTTILSGVIAGVSLTQATNSTSSASGVSTTAARASSVSTTVSAATSSSTGKVKYAGVNIAGFDFGCAQNGSCPVTSSSDPSGSGVAQMQHFVTDDGLNAFRLPVSWQYLVNAELGGALNSKNVAIYDKLVQSCLAVAELCIVSIHNYARWDGDIIGQSDGAVTNEHFASLWSQLATKYAGSPKIAFGVMNEPHCLYTEEWAETVQEVVSAIRKAGAINNMIFLPGNNYQSAGAFMYDGSSQELSNVINLDGSTTNLIFDLHLYLDSDGTGTHSTCTTNNTVIFKNLARWLRANGRQAFLSETGGGATDSCMEYVCQELTTIMANSDVYLGWTGWAAGAFSTSYVLSETPFGSAGSYTDQEIVTKCIAGVFNSVP